MHAPARPRLAPLLFAVIACCILVVQVDAQRGSDRFSSFWESFGSHGSGTQDSGTQDSGSDNQNSGGESSTQNTGDSTGSYSSFSDFWASFGSHGSGSQDSGTQDSGSDNQNSGSESPPQNTGSQDSGSGSQDSGSGTQNTGGETPPQGSDSGSGTQDSGTQNSGGETPPQDTGTQDSGSGTQDSGTQNTGGETPPQDSGTDNQNTGGDSSGQGGWRTGRATMYWGIHQGSCGYGELDQNRNTGWNIAAIPTSHPDYPGSCGACYEVKCEPMNFQDGYGNTHERTEACYDPNKSIVIAITDSCPCSSNQQWCCGDMEHLDLSYVAYDELADRKWGVIGLKYREVACPDPTYLERKDHYPPNGRKLMGNEKLHASLEDADSRIMNAGFTKYRPSLREAM